MSYYKAKFEREKKVRSTDWIIVPNGRSGSFKLVCLGGKG